MSLLRGTREKLANTRNTTTDCNQIWNGRKLCDFILSVIHVDLDDRTEKLYFCLLYFVRDVKGSSSHPGKWEAPHFGLV